MGTKRAFNEKDSFELPFKQSKLVDPYMISLPNDKESPITTQIADSPGEDTSNDGFRALTIDKKPDGIAPVFWVTTAFNDEFVGDESTAFWSTPPRYIDLGLPKKSTEPYVDPYLILMNCSPRKGVLIGPEHQAEVPLWNPNNTASNDECIRERRLLGNCIMFSDLNDSLVDCPGVGRGRIDCCCLDMGSMRCVQQHVKEAREKILQTFGHTKFSELGFFDMGQEVSSQWTSDEEQSYHEIVLSNPKSQGKSFWINLKEMFPNRTMMELVSYYFNVFMLQRRAVQNRSFVLEIDSDDDEECRDNHERELHWDAESENIDDQYGLYHSIRQDNDEQDSSVESFGSRDLDGDVSWADDFWLNHEGNSGYDCDNVKQVNKSTRMETLYREGG